MRWLVVFAINLKFHRPTRLPHKVQFQGCSFFPGKTPAPHTRSCGLPPSSALAFTEKQQRSTPPRANSNVNINDFVPHSSHGDLSLAIYCRYVLRLSEHRSKATQCSDTPCPIVSVSQPLCFRPFSLQFSHTRAAKWKARSRLTHVCGCCTKAWGSHNGIFSRNWSKIGCRTSCQGQGH